MASTESTIGLDEVLERAFRDATLPAYEQAGVRLWVLACNKILLDGQFDCFAYSVRHLHQAFPTTQALKTLFCVIENAPVGPLLPFKDDPSADIQIVTRRGCDVVLLAFCGQALRLGLPLDLVHLWLGRLPVNLIYLRDPKRLCGAAGFPSLGGCSQTSIEALKRKIADLGASRIVTYGTSSGGFPALYYGLALGAHSVLALAPTTNLSVEFQTSIGPVSDFVATVRSEFPKYGPDLRLLYRDASRPPRALLAYGADNARDSAQVENMAGLTTIELIPVEGVTDHNLVIPLIASGNFPGLLARLLSYT
jgi:hypothetical protein